MKDSKRRQKTVKDGKGRQRTAKDGKGRQRTAEDGKGQDWDWERRLKNGKITAINLEKKRKWIKVAVSSLAAIFLICLYVMIFFFSQQDGETSGSLSQKVTEVIVDQVEEIAHKSWSEEWKAAIVSYWEHPVRKLAHFSEYAAMGMLLFCIWYPWVTLKKWRRPVWKWNGMVTLWVFFSAALDEWHQTYVSGRCGSIWDVLLDTSGGVFGLAVCVLVISCVDHGQRARTKGHGQKGTGRGHGQRRAGGSPGARKES